jgi:DNA gyrase inhibitor GyrI
VLSIIDKKAKESQHTSGNGGNVDKINPLVIGLYYDDPESVPEDELRFAVGAVLSKGI